MTDFYYDGPIVLTASRESGLQSEAWLMWSTGEEDDLVSSLVEALGLDEESMADSRESVEVHARVRVLFDPYRAKLNGEDT